MNWCILISLTVGGICAILGYIIGKRLTVNNHDEYEDRIRRLENSLEESKKAKSRLDLELKMVRSSDSKISRIQPIKTTVKTFDAFRAKSFLGKSIKENDLTIVQGIEPKIQELFQNNNISTWKSLSECSIDKCQHILNSGGEQFAIYNPESWPKQAKMVYEGRWKELLKWHKEIVLEN